MNATSSTTATCYAKRFVLMLERGASPFPLEPTPPPSSPSRCAGAATAATSSSATMTKTGAPRAAPCPQTWNRTR